MPVPPTGAFVSQADLALRADGELLRGTITLQGEVLRDGPTAVPLLSGGTLIRARLCRNRVCPGSRPGLGPGARPGRRNRRADLQQPGVFHAVLSAGAFTLQIEWAGAIATEPGRAWQTAAARRRDDPRDDDAPGEGSDLTIGRALIRGGRGRRGG